MSALEAELSLYKQRCEEKEQAMQGLGSLQEKCGQLEVLQLAQKLIFPLR